jgi:hypothetical protein
MVVRHKRSQGSDGFLQIWLNGKLAMDYQGVTGQSSEPNGFWKHGIYIGQNIDSSDFGKEVVVYFDDVKIATGPNQYDAVAPDGTGGVFIPGPCHVLSNGQPVPQGYGAAYNVLSSQKELLLAADCQAGGTDVAVGNGNSLTYVYNRGYETSGGSWSPVSFQCTGQTISGAWCVGKATGTVKTTSSWYVGYTCFWTGSQWKCGCRDGSCAQNFWQLQGVIR